MHRDSWLGFWSHRFGASIFLIRALNSTIETVVTAGRKQYLSLAGLLTKLFGFKMSVVIIILGTLHQFLPHICHVV